MAIVGEQSLVMHSVTYATLLLQLLGVEGGGGQDGRHLYELFSIVTNSSRHCAMLAVFRSCGKSRCRLVE